ncbi:MAG: (2Fe-2S) ferredoxin domain-containing protein [Clostridia bacterium]|nr:(2Fe-2S) ferredoxin domain-containing protein [Clostridia bacterium]
MLTISICVGSSCHLKGAPKIVHLFREAISENNLKDKVTLSATFCLGRCAEGVCVKIGEDVIVNVSVNNFDEIFEKHVLGALK